MTQKRAVIVGLQMFPYATINDRLNGRRVYAVRTTKVAQSNACQVKAANVDDVRIRQFGIVMLLALCIWPRSSVVALLMDRGPAAIARAIRAVIVNAIQLMTSGWTRAHVCQKGGEVITPSSAHDDASTAPVAIARVGSVVAATAHVAPRFVLWRAPATRLVSMLCESLASAFGNQAAAAAACACHEMTRADRFDLPAVALALPLRMAAAVCGAFKDEQAIEASSVEVW